MSNELAKTQNTDLSTELQMPEGAWGSENVSSKDMLISKILLQQPLSTFVVDGKASPGDMCDSVTGEVLGSKSKTFEIIPFSFQKTWSIFKMVNGKFDYCRQEPVTPENESLPYEFEEDGVKMQRNKDMNFFVLTAKEAKEPGAFPKVITFRRTSTMAGKNLATFFQKASMMKLPPAAFTFELGCEMQKNDKGSYFVYTIKQSRKSTVEELNQAYMWYKTLQTQAHKIDESDDVDTAVKTQTTSSDQF